MIDIMEPVPAAGDDVDMPGGSDSNPLHSRLQIIKSLLQTFMRPIFPQDSLLKPFKYFEVFVDCTSLLQPRRGSTFHVNFRAFVQSSKNKTDKALRKLIPESSEISLSWALCKDGLGQNEIYQACISKSESNPWSSLFSLGSMVPNNQAKSLEKKKRKVSSFTIIRSELKREPNSDMQVFFVLPPSLDTPQAEEEASSTSASSFASVIASCPSSSPASSWSSPSSGQVSSTE